MPKDDVAERDRLREGRPQGRVVAILLTTEVEVKGHPHTRLARMTHGHEHRLPRR